ncbi:hypothetical protein JXB31_03860, partial [Candidatus Woesearchaeota archaeon]|nr:hypothetical protein [Candidatus Woesearchaeota archaeon]
MLKTEKNKVVIVLLFIGVLIFPNIVSAGLCVSDYKVGVCGYCDTYRDDPAQAGYYLGSYTKAWCTGTSGRADALCWESECVGGTWDQTIGEANDCWGWGAFPTKVECCTDSDCKDRKYGPCRKCIDNKCESVSEEVVSYNECIKATTFKWATTIYSSMYEIECLVYSPYYNCPEKCCGDDAGECRLHQEPYDYPCLRYYPGTTEWYETTCHCSGGDACCNPNTQCFYQCNGDCWTASNLPEDYLTWQCGISYGCYYIPGKTYPEFVNEKSCSAGYTCNSTHQCERDCVCSAGDPCCSDGCNYDAAGTQCGTDGCGQCGAGGTCTID